ncbi:hypothetical protein SAMN05216323_100568 [Williamwhitmania taraxaci]|uniref:Uncharacterized protein n=1 Tax=Williamwhitmania taraxaci TaxID=1640674 RepID=A0A1G6GZT2_9BACT|nr:hypothetical protein SAMN05216323_100568 [Williamwhitmania taraxaci]
MATVDKNPIKAIYLTFTNEFKTFANSSIAHANR